jgi:hypothetical protein
MLISRYDWSYEIRADGKPVDHGQLASPIVPPGQTKEVDVSTVSDLAAKAAQAQREVMVTFKMKLIEDTAWAKAGHVVAWEQFAGQRILDPHRRRHGVTGFLRRR